MCKVRCRILGAEIGRQVLQREGVMEAIDGRIGDGRDVPENEVKKRKKETKRARRKPVVQQKADPLVQGVGFAGKVRKDQLSRWRLLR